MDLRRALILCGAAVLAVAAWVTFGVPRTGVVASTAAPTMAPAATDYLRRDQTIAFYERARGRDRLDSLTPRLLAQQELQRYRERGDIGDVLRAVADAGRSLRAQPRANVAADVTLASALVDLHRFRDALRPLADAESANAADGSLLVREAGVDLELGEFERARTLLERSRSLPGAADTYAVTRARYDELTGHLADARSELRAPMQQLDSVFDAPAENRAWFHFRAGELAFEAGDATAAESEERTALQLFPGYWHAETALARITCGLRRWNDCLTAARASASVIPYPDALGFEVDAQRALGHGDEARQTGDLIGAIERLGNAQHVSDRLLAIYYDEHDEHLDAAYEIARRDARAHPDLGGFDTLAWAAAKAGHWDVARSAIRRVLRFDTEDARMQYHAGMIALHDGDRAETRRRLERALHLNPAFRAADADAARAALARL